MAIKMRILVVALIMPLLLLAGGVSASAHAQRLTAYPAVGKTIYVAPTQVSITFDDDLIELQGANQIVVLDPKQHQMQIGETSLSGATVEVKLRKLKLYGKYSVIYRVLSADGHPVSETYPFYFYKKKPPRK